MKKNHFRNFALSLVAALGLASVATANVPRNNQTVYAVSENHWLICNFIKKKL